MINFQKVLFSLSLTAFTFAGSLACAQNAPKAPDNSNAEPQAASPFGDKPQVILFKIHDIKPVVNAEGVTTACEYTATFFNRTPLSLRQAKVNFGWSDNISETFFAEEETDETQTSQDETENTPKPQNKPKEKEQALGTILSSVDLPALGSLRQISVQGRAETDKCFALFDNLKFEVPVCNILGQDQGREGVRGGVNCAGLFAYVNSKHPEYYGEFKEISYEEQVAMEKTAEQKESEEIAAINQVITTDLQQITTTLSNIK